MYIENDAYIFPFNSAQAIWLSAQATCGTLQTSLAAIHSFNDFEKARIKCVEMQETEEASTSCWMGLNDITTEGVWENDDGSTVDYYNWASAPAGISELEDCVEFNASGG